MKVGKILGCLNFGSADSPRVRGGQSAVHGTCSPEKFSIAKIHCGRSARISRTVREWTKRRILTAELIMSYKGISLVDHIHLGVYEMF